MYRPDYMRMPMEKHILSVYVTFSARMDYVGIYALNDGNCGGALSMLSKLWMQEKRGMQMTIIVPFIIKHLNCLYLLFLHT